MPVRAIAIKEHRNRNSGALLLFVKNDPAKLGHFCRAESASFDALRGVIGYLGAEIPVGDFMSWREHCRPQRTHRRQAAVLWVRFAGHTAYFMPRTAFAGAGPGGTAACVPYFARQRASNRICYANS